MLKELSILITRNFDPAVKSTFYDFKIDGIDKEWEDLTSKEKEELIDALFNGWDICRAWYQQDKIKKDGSNV